MATLNFPDNPSTGDKYTDTNSGFTYEWDGTVWKSSDPSTAANIREIDDISGSFNGSTTAFTLQVASVDVEPANVQQLIISVGGVMQNAGDDYTVSGSTITFTTAPSSGLTFFGTLLGTALSLNTVADGSVSPSSLTTTSNYIVGGINVAGVVTGGEFSGDGSGLTGVASTDNIITSYGATFLSNVRVAGVLTAANAYVTGILTAQTLNYNNVVDIYSTGIITATRGIQQTGNEGLHVSSGITTVGILTATSARVGLGVTINNTGIDAGAGVVTAFKAELGIGVTVNNTGIDAGIGAGIITAKDYYGNASNMTGIGITADIIAASPVKGSAEYSAVAPYAQISFNVNQGVQAGNADKEVELRYNSATGRVIESFGVGSSVTYAFGQAIIQPSGIGITNNETYFVNVPDGAFEAVGGGNSTGIVNDYSFDTKDYSRARYAQGQNVNGWMGGEGKVGNNQSVSSPVLVGADGGQDWAKISMSYGDGSGGALAIKTNGTLWAWGNEQWGGLGLNQSYIAYSSPVQVGSDSNWQDISGGYLAAGAIKTDGTLWMWGYNNEGQLGQNLAGGPGTAHEGVSSPTQVGTDTTWKMVAFNLSSGIAVKTDGTMWGWGKNTQAQLGLNQYGPTRKISSPTQIGTDTTWESVTNNYGYTFFASKNATSEPGRYLDKKGEVWSWGYNSYGALGLSDTTKRSSPTQIPGSSWDIVNPYNNSVAGFYGMFLTRSDGSLWSWGPNTDGCLGHNNNTNYSSPKRIGTKTDWNNKNNQMAGGQQAHSAVINDTGDLYVWGNNQYGQLGLSEQANKSSPIQLPGVYTSVVGQTQGLMQVTKNNQ